MSRPFARANAMHAAILSILTATTSHFAAAGAIEALGEYKSRGHGGKHRPQRSRPVMRGGRSKYQPHQGKKECARRVAQGVNYG